MKWSLIALVAFSMSILSFSADSTSADIPDNAPLEELRVRLTYAIVIGNEHYDNFPDYPGAAKAAHELAAHLASTGVIIATGGPLINASWDEIGHALLEFSGATRDGGIGIMYFAGHTYAVDSDNFMLPSDAQAAGSGSFRRSLFPLSSVWSFPRGREPGVLFTILETRGVLGLFNPPLVGSGTGLADFVVPGNVVVATAHRIGPIIVNPIGSLEVPRPAAGWLSWFRGGRASSVPAFTRAIIDGSSLVAGDTILGLEEAALQTAEASGFLQRPAIYHSGRLGTDLVFFRRAFEDAAAAVRDAAIDSAVNFSGSGLGASDLIRMMEALRLAPYLDSAGIATIGYGHTSGVGISSGRISEDEAERLLRVDIAVAQAGMDGVVRVPLNPNQKAALLSFVFNVGVQAFWDSTLLERINEGDRQGAAAEMLRWVNVTRNGSHIQEEGLVARRQLEAFLFLMPPEDIDASSLIQLFQPFFAEPQMHNGERMQGFGTRIDECNLCEQLDEVDLETALVWLDVDTQILTHQIDALVDVPLSRGQMVAVVSFAHRVGLEGFFRSPVYLRLQAGNYLGAANALRFGYGGLSDEHIELNERDIKQQAAEASLFFADMGPTDQTPGDS
jgi:lysozyme